MELTLLVVIFSNFLTIPVVKEKIRVKLALAVPASAPAILVNETVDNSTTCCN